MHQLMEREKEWKFGKTGKWVEVEAEVEGMKKCGEWTIIAFEV